ncbi:STAS domain-containing protein [Nocardioides currus]|uniref:STAS domain-containing protein n=1 Tax=Nocardioides currus TaxID=2133958 RepID=A0A2R7YUA8_9ACTN|nr:STAS domain-containing protein [Nocardioides currus]PUA79921.1 hypothetical protein C7S10_15250 [Nocardioides currus]
MSYLDSRLGGVVGSMVDGPGDSIAPVHRPHASAPGRIATIRCRSEVTGFHVANLVADLTDAAAGSDVVLVDLSRTIRIDAAGLGALVSGARACREAHSELCIVGAAGMVARALRFTGLSRALSSYSTLDEAVEQALLPESVDEPLVIRSHSE